MRYLTLILIFFLPGGCTERRVVSEQELKEYVMDPENGLRKSSENNGIDIEIMYKPTDLILAQQLDGLTDARERTKTISNFTNLSYFVITLSRKGQEIENAFAGDPEKFLRVTNHLASGIAAEIYMLNDTDTLPALDAVYTRMFGAATATSLMAVFDVNLKDQDGELKVCLKDTELGIGQNVFAFDLADIKKAPNLNLN